MLRISRWGMVERIALVLFGAVLLELGGNVALHLWQERELVSVEQTRRTARQLASAVGTANAAPAEDRAALMRGLNFAGASFNWVPRTVITDSSHNLPPLAGMRERLLHYGPGLAGHEVRLSLLPSDGGRERDLLGTVELEDGSFISFRVRGYMAAPPSLAMIVALHLLLTAGVFSIALLMVRTLVRPLRDLAAAADETGRDSTARIVPAGPHEVRRVASAFAAMQARLLRSMDDNTQALVAVSHDLRTPIQRLRLRAGMLRDEEAQHAIADDLTEMECFIDATLAYVRSGLEEPPRLIDLSSLITTLVDDACDMGVDARYSGPDELAITARGTGLSRMIGNLIDNGGKYARRVEITLAAQEDGGALILVEDDGPGIPPGQRERALQPFQRLDRPDDAEARGVGLGLAFVKRTVEAHGGTLALGTSRLGGLSVRICLPPITSG